LREIREIRGGGPRPTSPGKKTRRSAFSGTKFRKDGDKVVLVETPAPTRDETPSSPDKWGTKAVAAVRKKQAAAKKKATRDTNKFLGKTAPKPKKAPGPPSKRGRIPNAPKEAVIEGDGIAKQASFLSGFLEKAAPAPSLDRSGASSPTTTPGGSDFLPPAMLDLIQNTGLRPLTSRFVNSKGYKAAKDFFLEAGLALLDNAGGGDCGPHALFQALRATDEGYAVLTKHELNTPFELRQRIVLTLAGYIADDKLSSRLDDRWLEYLEGSHTTAETWIHKMEKPGTWADGIWIAAAAVVLDIRIVLRHTDDPAKAKAEGRNLVHDFYGESEKLTVYMANIRDRHFLAGLSLDFVAAYEALNPEATMDDRELWDVDEDIVLDDEGEELAGRTDDDEVADEEDEFDGLGYEDGFEGGGEDFEEEDAENGDWTDDEGEGESEDEEAGSASDPVPAAPSFVKLVRKMLFGSDQPDWNHPLREDDDEYGDNEEEIDEDAILEEAVFEDVSEDLSTTLSDQPGRDDERTAAETEGDGVEADEEQQNKSKKTGKVKKSRTRVLLDNELGADPKDSYNVKVTICASYYRFF
jgi:hypothetical protein